MNPYQKLVTDIEAIKIDQPLRAVLRDILEVISVIVRERRSDIKDFDNLQNRFISGRKTGKVPTGAADVDPSDKVGDINFTASYVYVLIDNAGTAEWRRAALSTW